jgi:hypothetical protein
MKLYQCGFCGKATTRPAGEYLHHLDPQKDGGYTIKPCCTKCRDRGKDRGGLPLILVSPVLLDWLSEHIEEMKALGIEEALRLG